MTYLLICYFFNAEKCKQAATEENISNVFIVVAVIAVLAILIKRWNDEK
jgi:hypothetical protein